MPLPPQPPGATEPTGVGAVSWFLLANTDGISQNLSLSHLHLLMEKMRQNEPDLRPRKPRSPALSCQACGTLSEVWYTAASREMEPT